MKVLVLSCSTGGGHNAAARAVYEELLRKGHKTVFLDAFQLNSDRTARNVGKVYVKTVQHAPVAFGTAYQMARMITSKKRKSPVYYANQLIAAKLETYIKKNKFDLVIASHLYPAETLTYLKNKGRLSIPTIVICTDYTCIPFWEETSCDAYILPHPELTEEYVKRGIPQEKLFPYGIPVSEGFIQNKEKKEARALLKLEEKPTHLIMTGSMGFGHVEQLIRELLDRRGSEHQIAVICGSNRALFRALKEQFWQEKNVRIVGYTRKVSIFMDAADVLYSKPGGLSSTEAIVKRIPMVHTRPIPGCETYNRRFFRKHGMAAVGSDVVEEADAGIRLIENERLRKKMIQAQEANSYPDAAQMVVRLAQVMTQKD